MHIYKHTDTRTHTVTCAHTRLHAHLHKQAQTYTHTQTQTQIPTCTLTYTVYTQYIGGYNVTLIIIDQIFYIIKWYTNASCKVYIVIRYINANVVYHYNVYIQMHERIISIYV